MSMERGSCITTSSALTYIMILCAYYFDRQASHRQVKASAQSSPSNQLRQQQCSPELSELVSVVGSAHSCSTGSNGPHTTVAGTAAALAAPVHLVQEPHWLHQGRDGGSYPPSVRPSPPTQSQSAPVLGQRTDVHPHLGYRTFRGDGREGAKRLTWLRSKMARIRHIVNHPPLLDDDKDDKAS